MPAIISPGGAGFALSGADPAVLPDDASEDGVWYLDHLRHDDFTIYQTLFPENLHFILNTRDKDTIDYEISLSATLADSGSPVVSGPDFIHPWSTCWQLRYGTQVISAGPHTEVSGVEGEDFMKVAGVSWEGYLERCMYPYDPRRDHIFDYAFDDAPRGLAYQAYMKDAGEILEALWGVVFSRPNRMPLTYAAGMTGVTVPYYRLDLGDTSTFLSIIQSFADIKPGFDFWIDPVTLEFKIASPYIYGTPAAIIADGEFGDNIVYDTNNTSPESVEFTNSGPEETHLLTTGSGLSVQLGKALGTILGEGRYWRLDGTYDAGDVYNQEQLNDMAGQYLSYGLNPIHQIPVTVDPKNITDFWLKMKPGVAIWVNEDLEFHQIDSPQRVVSMEGTMDNNGNMLVSLGLNQIYDTSDDAGIDEG